MRHEQPSCSQLPRTLLPISKVLKLQPETPTKSLIVNTTSWSQCGSRHLSSRPALTPAQQSRMGTATFLSKWGRYKTEVCLADASPTHGVGSRCHYRAGVECQSNKDASIGRRSFPHHPGTRTLSKPGLEVKTSRPKAVGGRGSWRDESKRWGLGTPAWDPMWSFWCECAAGPSTCPMPVSCRPPLPPAGFTYTPLPSLGSAQLLGPIRHETVV